MTALELLSKPIAAQSAYGLLRFRSFAMAQATCYRTVRPCFVMLGDDERFWVVPARFTAGMVRAGYEYAL